ncbi:MAG: succinate--CoA ligase subunit alpha [Bacteroidales bacterium]|nr:succinate--CoA ligase subunit alpha [Bacteroidales bacterium]MDD2424673.1 succinate--CoA ligase subunit alpha [Bacteroidales bacterium]MDD3989879.1 succinate--CoA ligase subunit alpha [Bacteroidales bacterium]MDD4638128.1 succinate--CoA ligase subunit alpha [Bacteroidales bacterium]
MSILINKNTRLLVQGITGRDGSFHASRMKSYGTNVVAGTSPGKGGSTVDGMPVYNTVYEAVKKEQADTSIIFVPPGFVKDAVMESADAGIKLIIIITEGVPTLDIVAARHYASALGASILGPNCPGVITPGESLAGIMPGNIFKPGKTGVISRSGTLTYEVVYNLTGRGIGQSTAIGIGGDPVAGLYFTDLLRMFQEDMETDSIVLIGEIGGDSEEKAAEFIRENVTKPVVAFIAGATAPEGKRMGHAGAIISSGSGTAAEKVAALKNAGVRVVSDPAEIPYFI